MLGSTHILPGIKAILNISGRAGLDLVHLVLRGNRKFILMKSEEEMRGFVLELKRTIPTLVRGELMAEVEGVDRFVADSIYIPEERQGLYLNDQ